MKFIAIFAITGCGINTMRQFVDFRKPEASHYWRHSSGSVDPKSEGTVTICCWESDIFRG